jgi:hypothetical protein
MFNLFNFAYLDPGTGSLIIQSLIGVIAGVSVFGRNAIANITGKAKRALSRSNDKAETTRTKVTEAKEAE